MKPCIYITRKLPDKAIEPLLKNYEVHMWDRDDVPVPYEILLKEANKANALLTMLSDPINEEVLSTSKNLKVVANLAVGFDNIDLQSAKKYGITICNTPDVLTDSTADLTFSLLMAASRRIVEAADFVKNGQWKGWSPFLLAGHDIHHKTIGIVGMGKIGQAVAKRAKGFDMEILYYNRNRNYNAETLLGATYCTFEEIIEKSDFVVCLTPLTVETKKMFTEDVFKKMKRSAVFINASRGPVVDEDALYQALLIGDIAAAGLDVFNEEPINKDHPLLMLPNVVALPHIGSASTETRLSMIKLCVENIDSVLNNKEPKTSVKV